MGEVFFEEKKTKQEMVYLKAVYCLSRCLI